MAGKVTVAHVHLIMSNRVHSETDERANGTVTGTSLPALDAEIRFTFTSDARRKTRALEIWELNAFHQDLSYE